MTDCLFCNIIQKKIPASIVFEDDDVLAFDDINPQAPHHILIIPKKHIETINDLSNDDTRVAGKLMLVAKQLAAARNIAQDGYRITMNCNAHGGQEVFHIHLHLLGGRQMAWPPG